MLTGWRIADAEYSQTIEMMLSGEGAYLFGGRWNSTGKRVVYLGTSLAQASMELLVHLNTPQVLHSFNKLDIQFDESMMQHININDLPSDWAKPSLTPNVQEAGDQWIDGQESLILQVPSAAVTGEYNYLLNPAHPDMKHAQIGEITHYLFDPRLIKN